MKVLLSFLKPYKKQLFVGPLFKLVEAILELLLPLIMANVIDNYTRGTGFVLKMSGIMLGVAVIGLCSALVCQYYASIASQGYGTALRRAMLHKISGFSAADMGKFGASSLTNRITNDVNQLQNAVAMLIRLVIRAPFLCVGAAVLAMTIDLKLSIILIIIIPVFIVVLYIIMFWTVPMYNDVRKGTDRLGTIIRENLSGVRVIRAFDKVEGQSEKFDEANDRLYEMSVKVGKIAAYMNPATTFIMNCAVCAVLWFGGKRVYAGGLTTGEIIAYINYITQIMMQMIIVANLVIMYTRAFTGGKRVAEVLNYESDIKECENAVSLPEICPKGVPAIEFDRVSFSYDGGGKALSDVSFQANAGETVGIIGGTGSGKSTVINLLARFYDVTEGAIKLNGVDIRNCRLVDLRKKVAIVEQKPILFSGTIESNLKWGNPNASENELIEAAKLAQAYEFIEKKPDGFKSRVDRGGRNFSGGQRQRLAIARALAVKAKFLVLDDASSALDYATDSKLRSGLKTLKNTTVVLVSQRASAVAECDMIICLEAGHIAGMGTHSELYDSCEIYHEICRSQNFSREGKICE